MAAEVCSVCFCKKTQPFTKFMRQNLASLGGGFKNLKFSTLLGKTIKFDFFKWVETKPSTRSEMKEKQINQKFCKNPQSPLFFLELLSTHTD